MSVPIRMPRPKSFTIGEYLTIERKAATKSEFHKGQILAMAGGMPNHNSTSSNINGALWSQLRARKCRLFTGDQRVLVAEGEASYYPDVSVTCGEIKYQDRHRDVITNPALVVEVLSRSTSRYDRIVKLPLYKRTSPIRDILFVTQDRPRVEHFTRVMEDWKATEYVKLTDVIDLPNLRCILAIADVYANIEF